MGRAFTLAASLAPYVTLDDARRRWMQRYEPSVVAMGLTARTWGWFQH